MSRANAQGLVDVDGRTQVLSLPQALNEDATIAIAASANLPIFILYISSFEIGWTIRDRILLS
ncbi:MAG TPA: hypothetical protein VG498_22570 [Terriglobales bacterium]|nr:hypothetical protein [Terriglobales bacterium]